MKKFLLLISIFLLAACPESQVTEVANPAGTVTTAKAIGRYTSVEFNADEQNNFPEISFADIDNDCEDDDNVDKIINAGNDDNTIRMINFFDYNDEAEDFEANFNQATGAISFDNIGDAQNTISCSGNIVQNNDETLLALQCTVVGNQAENCKVTAKKTAEL
jgi:hypothetical protein